MKRVISTMEAPKAIGPYSQAVAAGPWLFCAGQLPITPESGELVTGDMGVQTTRVLENLGAVLRANQMSYAHVVKTTVFLVDLEDFAAMNAVYAIYFPNLHPARSTIEVAALPKGARIEIEATAASDLPPPSPSTLGGPVDISPASPY